MRAFLPCTWLVFLVAGYATAAAAAPPAPPAGADGAYPARPIRIVVPFTAGSATDIMARIVSPKMVERWGRQVVVDNRPSAGGVVACTIVAEAGPDGHTWLVTGSNFAGSAALYDKLPYDSVRDFSGITQLASTPLVLVVTPALGVKSLREFVALAREKGTQMNYGSTGLGSGPHYGAELFKLAAGLRAVHVPYRGSPESLNDLMAGRVQFILSPVLAASPLIRGGRVQALAVSTSYRAQALPEVPTAAEAGLPEFEYQGWYGILLPSRTPRALVAMLNREVTGFLDQTDVKERIATQGALAKPSSAEAFDKLVREEIATRRKVWQAAGVKAE